MFRDLWKELRRLIEALMGKRSFGVWKESISKFTDDAIHEVIDKDGSTYQGGMCTVEYTPGIDVSARIKLVFKSPSGQLGQVEAKRTFPERTFLSETLEYFAEERIIEFPIEAPEEK